MLKLLAESLCNSLFPRKYYMNISKGSTNSKSDRMYLTYLNEFKYISNCVMKSNRMYFRSITDLDLTFKAFRVNSLQRTDSIHTWLEIGTLPFEKLFSRNTPFICKLRSTREAIQLLFKLFASNLRQLCIRDAFVFKNEIQTNIRFI